MRTIPTESVRRGVLLLAAFTAFAPLAVPARAADELSSAPTEIKVQREKPEEVRPAKDRDKKTEAPVREKEPPEIMFEE